MLRKLTTKIPALAISALLLCAGCGLLGKKPAHVIQLGDKTELHKGEALKH